MIRSPPQLRSRSKGEAARPDKPQDKKNLQRSLSVPESTSPTTMAPGDKASQVDQSAVVNIVNKYLAGDDVIEHLVTRLSVALKTVVEEAVKTALTAYTEEMGRLRDKVDELTERLQGLDDKLCEKTDELEQYQRRNNVRIFGLDETTGEDTDAIVKELCRDKLGVDLPSTAICRSHRVGRQPEPGPDGRKRHRAIIVRFTSYQVRREVFAAKKKLKGSGVTIREDLTARRMEVLRKATAIHGIRSTWSQDGRILWIDKNKKKGMATRLEDLTQS